MKSKTKDERTRQMDAMDYIIKKHKAYETDLAKKAKEENQQDQARILKRIANEKYLKRIA